MIKAQLPVVVVVVGLRNGLFVLRVVFLLGSAGGRSTTNHINCMPTYESFSTYCGVV